MKVGQTVYTVNNVTNEVDSWTYAGALPSSTKGELLLHLANGNKYCFLPAKCVFEKETEAKFIAGSYQ